MGDEEIVAAQLERPIRSAADVVTRCHLDLPVVTRVPPILDDGTPFPTLYWLSCPLASRRIGRIESAGGVRSMQRWAESDPGFGQALTTAHRRYEAQRDELLDPDADPRPTGGVGGSEGIKCLHAHYADHAAGNDNPIGRATAPWVEPLECDAPCVVEEGGGVARRNPRWNEPR